jgi:hypothetical protein
MLETGNRSELEVFRGSLFTRVGNLGYQVSKAGNSFNSEKPEKRWKVCFRLWKSGNLTH